MSTKINLRSPFYPSYSEPTPPSVELTCALINLTGLSIDQFGKVTLPYASYGDILSYTCSDADFADGKFDTVLTDTSRTITFTISIPSNFSNAANDTIDCDATATQPEFVCTGGVTTSGTIPNQSVDTGGDTTTVDLSSYFTAGVDPIQGYSIINNYTNYFNAEITGNTLTITGTNLAGTKIFYVEATDNNPLTCDATQSIQVTTTSVNTYTCTDSYLSGGLINQDGSIVNPTVNGTITAIKTSSGGTPITSVPANNTGSFVQYTLYFDITVPTGYTNTGSTVECSKVYYQVSSSLPTFNCSVAALTGQAITLSGIISVGTANRGTIKSFSPLSFPIVSSNTIRTVTFTITAPSSGYNNSGQDITCDVTMIQPAAVSTCGTAEWYYSGGEYPFMTYEQVQAAYPNESQLFYDNNCIEYFLGKNAQLGTTIKKIALHSSNAKDNINTFICYYDRVTSYTAKAVIKYDGKSINPSGGGYLRINKFYESSGTLAGQSSASTSSGNAYFVKRETSGFISEVWFVDWDNEVITRIDNL